MSAYAPTGLWTSRRQCPLMTQSGHSFSVRRLCHTQGPTRAPTEGPVLIVGLRLAFYLLRLDSGIASASGPSARLAPGASVAQWGRFRVVSLLRLHSGIAGASRPSACLAPRARVAQW